MVCVRLFFYPACIVLKYNRRLRCAFFLVCHPFITSSVIILTYFCSFFCFSFIFNYTSPFIITSSRLHLHPHLITCMRSILDVLAFSLFFVCSFMLAFLNNTRNCDKQLRIIIKATLLLTFILCFSALSFFLDSFVIQIPFFFNLNSP